MADNHTESGATVNRMRYGQRDRLNRVSDIKKILWENVRGLMVAKYGAENLNRLAREAKIGPGGATRIKQAKTSVGIDVLDKVAKHFKVDTWQLLAPGLGDEKFLYVLRVWNENDGRGRRMLLKAAEGAAAEDEGLGDAQQTRRASR